MLHDAFHFPSLVWDWPIAIYLFLLGISAGASLLAVVAGSESVLPAGDFRTVFLLAALISLLALPGIRTLRPQDGATVSGATSSR